ncbi:MAG: hypothetical protein ABSA76_07210 [Bacteroidales bacterium]
MTEEPSVTGYLPPAKGRNQLIIFPFEDRIATEIPLRRKPVPAVGL